MDKYSGHDEATYSAIMSEIWERYAVRYRNHMTGRGDMGVCTQPLYQFKDDNGDERYHTDDQCMCMTMPRHPLHSIPEFTPEMERLWLEDGEEPSVYEDYAEGAYKLHSEWGQALRDRVRALQNKREAERDELYSAVQQRPVFTDVNSGARVELSDASRLVAEFRIVFDPFE